MVRHYCVYESFSGKGEGWLNLFFMKLSFYFIYLFRSWCPFTTKEDQTHKVSGNSK